MSKLINLRSDSKTIDDIEFKTQQFSTSTLIEMAPEYIPLVAPLLAAGAVDGAADVSALSPYLADAATHLAGKSLALVLKLLRNTVAIADGTLIELNTREKFDMVFNGRAGAMVDVIKFVFEVNFSGFTAGVPTVKDAAGTPTATRKLKASP